MGRQAVMWLGTAQLPHAMAAPMNAPTLVEIGSLVAFTLATWLTGSHRGRSSGRVEIVKTARDRALDDLAGMLASGQQPTTRVPGALAGWQEDCRSVGR